ncbi:hypothetical protein ACVWWO_003656 [Bradyrhizobium sp. F1.13.1]
MKAHAASVKDIAARLLAHRKIDRPVRAQIVIGRERLVVREQGSKRWSRSQFSGCGGIFVCGLNEAAAAA